MSKAGSNGNYFNRDAATDAITNAPGAASALSVSGWYYASAFGQVHQPLSMGTNDFDFLFVIEVNTGGAVRAYVNKSSTGQAHDTASTALSTGTWTHLAATWDGSTVRMYVNGVEAANVAGTITAQQAISYLECMYVNGGTNVTTMQDVTMWSAALSADEIMGLYRERMPRRRANLVTNWPMFPVSGNQADLSGNANNGIQNGTVPNGTVDAPAVWSGNSPRRLIPAGTAVSASGTGATILNGSGTFTAAAAASATGGTILNGTGTPSVARAVSGTGGTVLNGLGTATVTIAASATGQTLFNGTGTASSGLTATGQTIFNGLGTASVSAAVGGTGATTFNGLGTATVAVSSTGTGATVLNGLGTRTAAVAASGTGQTLFNGLGTVNTGGGGVGSGVDRGTQSTRRFSALVGRRRVR